MKVMCGLVSCVNVCMRVECELHFFYFQQLRIFLDNLNFLFLYYSNETFSALYISYSLSLDECVQFLFFNELIITKICCKVKNNNTLHAVFYAKIHTHRNFSYSQWKASKEIYIIIHVFFIQT